MGIFENFGKPKKSQEELDREAELASDMEEAVEEDVDRSRVEANKEDGDRVREEAELENKTRGSGGEVTGEDAPEIDKVA